MNRGRKWCLASGIAAAAIVLSFLLLSDEVRIQYYLYKLRSDSPEYLGFLMEGPEGSIERRAVIRYVSAEPGRQRLLSFVLGDLDALLSARLGRGGGGGIAPPSFSGLDHILCGLRLRVPQNEWVLWADTRWPGAAHRGTVAMHASSLPNGALAAVLEALCRKFPPGEEITLPEYPGLRFTIEPFEAGLERYQAILRTGGHSIESTAYWYETLDAWPEMLRSGTLLPWVIRARRTGR